MKNALDYLQIIIGTAIGAVAVNLFMLPNHLASGGMGGLLVILHYLWNVPIGTVYFLANLPILYWLYRLYGWHGVFKTLLGTVLFSMVVDMSAPLAQYAPTHNLLLATLYSGVLIGFGSGLALRVGGSTGGTSAIAQLVHHYTGLNVSRFLLYSDFVILSFGAIALNLEVIMYALVMTVVITRVIQTVNEGALSSRCLLIISAQPEEVAQAILTEVKRGVTRLTAQGEYSGQPRPVLMCVVNETEVYKLKRLVHAADPAAFVVVTDAREVDGPGFTLDTEHHRIPFWKRRHSA